MIAQYRDSQKVCQLLSLWWVLLEEHQLQDGAHHLRHQMLELSSSRMEPQRFLSAIQTPPEQTNVLNQHFYSANG